MKDSRGHGSNTRGASMLTPAGRGIMPSRPYRQSSEITSGPPAPGSNGGIEHQASIAAQHGVSTDHLTDADRRRTFQAAYGNTGGTMASRQFNGGHFAGGLGKFKS